jgi:predicted dehydrogenase
MTPTRVAMIGLGLWGARAHLPALAAQEDVEVAVIVEPNLGAARDIAGEFGVSRVEADAGTLWAKPDGIDAAVIATPVDTHRDLVMAAFAAGLDVLCEKPLAYTLAEADEMADAAATSGRIARMGFLSRCSPIVARMKELVDEGFIGELQLFESHTVNAQFIDPSRPLHWKMTRARANGGVFAEYGSHAIDLALWFGGPIDRVVAHGNTLIAERPAVGDGMAQVDVDDAASWIGSYANGGEASFRSSWASLPVGGGGLRLYGSRGSLAWCLDPTTRRGESLVAATIDDPEPRVLLEHTPPFDPRFDTGPFPLGLLARFNQRLIASFIADIRTGHTTGPSFEDGRRVQAVLAAIRTSLDEGRWVQV